MVTYNPYNQLVPYKPRNQVVPYKKKYKRYNKGYRSVIPRNYFRKANNSKNYSVKSFIGGRGIADQVYVKMCYVERFDFSQLLNYTSQITMKGNSLFDPNQSGTGHQPLYFDQYAALYSRYRVFGSAITVDVINNSGSAAIYYVVNATTDVNSFADIPTLLEQPHSMSPKIVPIAARVSSRTKMYASTRQVQGLAKTQIYDDVQSAPVTTDPNNVWYWNILFNTVDNLNGISGICIVKLVYFVEFYDRKFIAGS